MMKRSLALGCAGLAALLCGSPIEAAEITDHDLQVKIQPSIGRVFGEGTLTVEGIEGNSFTLRLGPGFALQEVRWEQGGDWAKARIGPGPIDGTARTRWSVTMPGFEGSSARLRVRWAGAPSGLQEARARAEVGAAWSYMNPSGAVLAPLSGWYPAAYEKTSTFALEVTVPESWEVVAEGVPAEPKEAAGATRTLRYTTPHPVPGLHLIAGPFVRAERAHRGGEVALYHREDIPGAVVRRTLLAMRQLLDEMVGEAGPWSWPRLALVQHPEVGRIDAPGFSLLGPRAWADAIEDRDALRVVIARAWWPGTVYPSGERGAAWAEGLAEFVARHRLQLSDAASERRDRRRTQLWRLQEDRPRTVDRAVMAFSMLETKLGRDRFGEALRGFLVERRYEATGWSELLGSFARVAREPLEPLAGEWLERDGLPRLEVTESRAKSRPGGARVMIGLAARPDWSLDVPVELRDAEGRRVRGVVAVRDGSGRARLSAPFVPERALIDPDHELLRELLPAETAPRLGALQRTEPRLVVVGSARGGGLERAARHLATMRSGRGEIARSDREVKPEEVTGAAPVLVLGKPTGALAERIGGWLPPGIRLGEDSITVAGHERSGAGTALAVALEAEGRTWVLVDALSAPALSAMTGRLESLAEQSWAVLDGDEIVASDSFEPAGHFDVEVRLEGEQRDE